MSVFPQELLDGLGAAIALEQYRRLLVVARKEVDGGVTSDVDALGGVIQCCVHLCDDQL